MRVRIFISVELPEEIKKNLVELIEDLKKVDSGVKWVERQNLHLTLKFLGWVEEKQMEEIFKLTEEAAAGRLPAGRQGKFEAELEEIGSFPRVFWIGVSNGKEELIKLTQSLEKKFSGAGYRTEEREYAAHLTIGRVKDKKGVDQLKEKIKNLDNPKFGKLTVDRISIMKSALRRQGPVYELIKEVKL